ncbi:MAG: methionine gamma-lyase family protein, partial [Clostridia bacterium]|nr:methionine gamma-lyase family protein [Clostridia bacterium]
MINKLLNNEFSISDEALRLLATAEDKIRPMFEETERIAAYNQAKVLAAFKNNRVSYAHFGETSGYGYDDMGRDTLDTIFAEVFGAESAMVRHNIVSGTQAIASCLYGVLRPGDTMVSVVGKPYDTMEEVIGLRGDDDCGSLKDFGINYEQIDLLPGGEIDYGKIKAIFSEKNIKLALIQRSRGYDWRNSLTVDKIGEIIKTIKYVSPETICMVDNCYGEFVETKEPTEVGADIIVGSLIKNPGGSLAL